MNNVAKIRREKGYTQKQLADKVKLYRSHLSLIENGKVGTSIETAYRISNALDVPLLKTFPNKDDCI